MLHTNFRENLPAGSGEEDFWRVFTIYGRGGHLGHLKADFCNIENELINCDFAVVLPSNRSFWDIIKEGINIRLYYLLPRFHYILNLPRI